MRLLNRVKPQAQPDTEASRPAGELARLRGRVEEAQRASSRAESEHGLALAEVQALERRCRELLAGLPKADDVLKAQRQLEVSRQGLDVARRKVADFEPVRKRRKAELRDAWQAVADGDAEAARIRDSLPRWPRYRWGLEHKLAPRKREVAALEAQLAKSHEQERAMRGRLAELEGEGDEGPDAAA